MNIRWTVGDLVRKLRGEMTQETLAEKAGVNKATVVRLEVNSDNAKQATIAQIAKELGTTSHDLGAYVEALNLANQIVQLGPKGREAVRRFLDARLRPSAEPDAVPAPTRESRERPPATAVAGRAGARKVRDA